MKINKKNKKCLELPKITKTLVVKCFLNICPSLAQTCAPMMLMDGLLASFHQLILVALQCSWYVQSFSNLFLYQLQLCCNSGFLGHWIADFWGFHLYNFKTISEKQNSFCRYFWPFSSSWYLVAYQVIK